MAPLLLPLALFFLITAGYGAALNLCGDEAYALNVAAKSVGEILAADPFHLPTYYLILHPIVGFFPAGNELPLRLIHALIFSIGLGFCWRIARPQLAASQRLRLMDVKPVGNSFPRGTFVYVQLMAEDGEESDPQRLCGEAAA